MALVRDCYLVRTHRRMFSLMVREGTLFRSVTSVWMGCTISRDGKRKRRCWKQARTSAFWSVTNSDAPDTTFPDPRIYPTCASGKEHVESV